MTKVEKLDEADIIYLEHNGMRYKLIENPETGNVWEKVPDPFEDGKGLFDNPLWDENGNWDNVDEYIMW